MSERLQSAAWGAAAFLLLGPTPFGGYASSARAAEKTAEERSLERTAREFRRLDRDQDDSLSLDEFFTGQPEPQRRALRRKFASADFDLDGKLSRGEFCELTDPPERRGPLHDPFVEFERAALEKWLALTAAADRNGDGKTSREEWPAEKLAAAIPALAEVPFDQFDRNGDGQVEADEGRRLLEVAYGLTQLDGRPLRMPNGRVFSWYYFRAVDENGDGILSRDEFVSRHWQGPKRSAELMVQLDANADGQLTIDETLRLLWHDALRHFFICDRDFDGYLTTDELFTLGWGRSLARRTVPAFDDDGDGRLSFAEFRLTIFTNQASDWVRLRRDADHDGHLSWREFYIEKPPLLFAQSRYYFDRFDLDKDGFLTPDELEFEIDYRAMQPDAVFRIVDKDADGAISPGELIQHSGRPEPEIARDFRLFDRDADGHLDESEFSTLPMLVAFDHRSRLPDPLLKLVERYVALVDNHWDDWDADSDGELSWVEFARGLNGALPWPIALEELAPDLSGDGVLSRDEARGAIEALLGTRVVNAAPRRFVFAPGVAVGGAPRRRVAQAVVGQSLRSPGGAAFNLIHFRQLDRDRSLALDVNELNQLGVAGWPPAAVLELCDADQDRQISLSEWWHVPVAGAMEPVNEFRGLDADFDGLVDRDELRNVPSYKMRVAEHTLPGFDLDGDGKLSLAEYRFCPLGNPLVDWYRPIIDDDGTLTFDELLDRTEPFFLLYWHYFERFDLNADGVLDRGEFQFHARTPEALYALNADGTGWSKLFELPGCPIIGSPAVSLDGKSIAFDASRVVQQRAGQVMRAAPNIFVVDIDGRHCKEICQGQLPSWSADGQLIACSRVEGNSRISIMTIEGREHRRLGNGWSAQWSPDGKKIAYYLGAQLRVYDVETRQSRDVLDAAHAYRQLLWGLGWSPDSKQICFQGISQQRRQELVLVDAGGAERGIKVRYSATPFSPRFAWHPREKRLVFSMTCPERGVVQLYELDPTTDEPPTLVAGQDPTTPITDPCWTPDGKRLIVVSGEF